MKVNNHSNPERKDTQGHNTILSLEYFRGFNEMLQKKHYLNMNIHERIAVRASYCGVVPPSVCIGDLIEFNRQNS